MSKKKNRKEFSMFEDMLKEACKKKKKENKYLENLTKKKNKKLKKLSNMVSDIADYNNEIEHAIDRSKVKNYIGLKFLKDISTDVCNYFNAVESVDEESKDTTDKPDRNNDDAAVMVEENTSNKEINK